MRDQPAGALDDPGVHRRPRGHRAVGRHRRRAQRAPGHHLGAARAQLPGVAADHGGLGAGLPALAGGARARPRCPLPRRLAAALEAEPAARRLPRRGRRRGGRRDRRPLRRGALPLRHQDRPDAALNGDPPGHGTR
ncbi:hypothetical protein MAP_3421c [Mycobacterium avium subsp. paratuberculosis K-10]|uniref:Uncharacterized protein n=1 Tax=Mycolicibacterium paratuberculosis (strain ATCC BAA-968 / K-10) TaxID=262316 RepID=Q73UE7_MYCPA|nr:hypothetical protein MAP_3421c [Mycobacterium avium subsp. paratuberculosis K-10]